MNPLQTQTQTRRQATMNPPRTQPRHEAIMQSLKTRRKAISTTPHPRSPETGRTHSLASTPSRGDESRRSPQGSNRKFGDCLPFGRHPGAAVRRLRARFLPGLALAGLRRELTASGAGGRARFSAARALVSLPATLLLAVAVYAASFVTPFSVTEAQAQGAPLGLRPTNTAVNEEQPNGNWNAILVSIQLQPRAAQGTVVRLAYEESRPGCLAPLDYDPPGVLPLGNRTTVTLGPGFASSGEQIRFYPGLDDVKIGNCTVTVTLVPAAGYTPTEGIADGSGANAFISITLNLTDTRDSGVPPVASLTAPGTANKGDTITFTISLAPVPATAITIGLSGVSDGNFISTIPDFVAIAANEDSATFNVVTNAAAAADSGDVVVTMVGGYGAGFAVAAAATSASVDIASGGGGTPTPSATPTIALDDTTNGGSNDDNLTNTGEPTFNIGNLATGATVTVLAVSPNGSSHVRLMTVAASATEAVTFAATGTSCEVASDGGTFFLPFTSGCNLSDQGDWTITATQHAPGALISETVTLTLTLDTTAPTLTLATGETNLAASGATATITATVSEASNLEAGDFTVSGGGTLSGFTTISGAGIPDNTYTIIYTSANATASEVTATISVAADAYADTAGNNDGVGASVDITVAAMQAQSTPPTIALDDASNSGSNTDNITNDGTPTFNIGSLTTNATVTVLAVSPSGLIHVRLTTVATGATESLTYTDNSSCDYSFDSGANFRPDTQCFLNTGDDSDNGGWTITATQHAPGETISEAAMLTMTLDTVDPTLTLTSDATNLAASGATATITATVSEASDLAMDDFTVSGGGTLSGFAAVMGEDNTYTITFTSANADTNEVTATISVAADAYADTAGNNDGTGASVDITVAAGAAALPV
ncbi:MAG: Ig-like domain-containing protein, partial [Pseudohongiellaceae bacterium]